MRTPIEKTLLLKSHLPARAANIRAFKNVLRGAASRIALMISGAAIVGPIPTNVMAQQVYVGSGTTLDQRGTPFTVSTSNQDAVKVVGGTLILGGAPISITANGGSGIELYNSGAQGASVTIVGSQSDHAKITAAGVFGTGVNMYGYLPSTLYLENVDIDAGIGGSGTGVYANGPGTVTIMGGTIRAANGIHIMGPSALVDGTKVITNAAGAGFSFGDSGVVVSNTPSVIVARNFDILTGVDYNTGLANGSRFAYGILTGKYAIVSLENGRVETWGQKSAGIWAGGDYNDVSQTQTLFHAKDVDIVTHGDGANGFDNTFVRSEMIGGSIHTFGDNSDAVTAGNGGVASWPGSHVTLIGTRLTTEGNGSYGLFSWGGSTIDATGVQITTRGESAIGARATGASRLKLGDGSSIVTEGFGAHGAAVTFGSQIDIEGSSILTKGEAGAGIFMSGYNTPANVTPTTKNVNVANVTNSTIEARQAAALRVRGAFSNTFNLTGSHIIGSAPGALLFSSSDYIYDDGQGTVVPMPSGTIDVNAKASLLEGNILAESGLVTFNLRQGSLLKGTALVGSSGSLLDRLTIDATSGWEITGSSTLNHLTNAGTIGFAAPEAGAFKTLTVNGDYVSDNGALMLNARLGDDSSPTDKAIFNGSVSGVTRVSVNNAGGLGALTTGSGINVIDARQAASGAFVQNGRIAAGAYEYTLYAGPSSGGFDGNWYLRSTYVPPITPPVVPPEPPVVPPVQPPVTELPDYRVEVATDMVAPALAHRFGLAMLGTYQDRIAAQKGQRIWARAFGETGSFGRRGGSAETRLGDFTRHGSSYDFNLGGIQLGADLFEREGEGQTRDTAGIYFGTGRIDSDVRGVYRGKAGETALDGYALGAYWTHLGDSGWYLDAVAQGTRYANLNASSTRGETLQSDGWGFAASLEGGYPVALGDGWTIEPQAQLVYQTVSLKDGADRFGRIDFDTADGLYGRAGSKIARAWALEDGRAITAWARANVWTAFGATAKTTFTTLSGTNPVALKTSLGGTWGQLGIGASGQLSLNTSLFGSLDYNHSLDGGRGYSVGGRVGLAYTW